MKYMVLRILVFIICLVLGSVINGLIVSLGYLCIPLPQGINMNDPEAFKWALLNMRTVHFIFPFLAHAIGTFVSAWFWCSIKRKTTWKATLGFATIFFSGGLYMAIILDAPLFFEAIDLCYAYFPMGLFGYSLRLKTTQII